MKRLSRRALLQALPFLWVGLGGAIGALGCTRGGQAKATAVGERATPSAEPPATNGERTASPPRPTSTPPRAAAAERTVLIADVTASGWNRFGQEMAASLVRQPEIEITWRSVSSWPAYPQRVATLNASGLLGDIVEAPFGALLRYWARQEIIRPLDPLLAPDDQDLEDIFGAARAACRVEGQIYGLPIVAHAGESLLLASTAVLEEAGQTAPGPEGTLDDLVAVAEAVRGAPEGPYGYASRLELPSAYPILHAFGARLVTDDGQQGAIAEEAGIACLSWLSEQMQARRTPRPLAVEGGLLDMLRRGRLALLRHSFGAYQALLAAGVPLSAALHPRHPETGLLPTLATGVAYCLTHSSQNPEAAVSWMRALSSREAGVGMLLGGYSVPGCRVSSWSDGRVVERYPVCPEIAQAAHGATLEAPLPNERIPELYGLWEQHTAPLWRGERSASECAVALQTAIEQLLAQPPDPNGPTRVAAMDPTIGG